MGFVEGVLVGLTVAAIGAVFTLAYRWLRDEDNRQRLREWVCLRHDWKPLDSGGPLDFGRGEEPLIVVTGYSEYCSKCGAERVNAPVDPRGSVSG